MDMPSEGLYVLFEDSFNKYIFESFEEHNHGGKNDSAVARKRVQNALKRNSPVL